MDKLLELQHQIEEMRSHLHELVIDRGSFANDEVRELSTKLDKMILEYQNLKKAAEQRGA